MSAGRTERPSMREGPLSELFKRTDVVDEPEPASEPPRPPAPDGSG